MINKKHLIIGVIIIIVLATIYFLGGFEFIALNIGGGLSGSGSPPSLLPPKPDYIP